MTCYVDPLFSATPRTAQARSWGNRWCHMTADTTEELLAMMARLGLRASYLQDAGTWGEHVDLVPSKRALAVRYGAVELTSSEMGQRWVERRERNGAALEGRSEGAAMTGASGAGERAGTLRCAR